MGVTLPQSHAPENPSVMPPPGTAPDADYFKALQAEVSDKGFLVTSTEDLFNWARTGSLWWMTFGLACCAVEMIQVNMPRYDLERFGAAPRASPRQSDRSEEHTSELPSLMRISSAVFCLKKKNKSTNHNYHYYRQ